jgi:NADH-quinone oxidoreductase subunit L
MGQELQSSMLTMLWLIPALPLAGAVLLALLPLSRTSVAWVGCGTVGLSALVAGLVANAYLGQASPEPHVQVLWQWMSVTGFEPRVSFYLDPLSLVMILVVTGVGFLIHLYSTAYMAGESGYRRFFAYLNLFVGAMLLLVLAEDLLLLLVGWEGVGLCSYLLIGFWYTDPANDRAARKAFIVTRIGDAAMVVGLLLVFTHLGSLRIPLLQAEAAMLWQTGAPLAVAAAALLLAGAVGKSAQFPLQVWLPDAMAGPTPVSALIHAATMVTAGVYLVARTHVLFALAPPVQDAVALIGVVTLLLAAFAALGQSDIKRVLAWSTISQIGYMFLALGLGAWGDALFHLMTHAFFKALLFLAAGMVILRMAREHDIFKMGGLWRSQPLAFLAFLAGALSLAAVPGTAGYFSKDRILADAWAGSVWLWAGALTGAFLTSVYIFRALFLVFFGAPRGRRGEGGGPGLRMGVPLLVLAGLALAGGLLRPPLWSASLEARFGWALNAAPEQLPQWVAWAPILAGLGGIVLAAMLYVPEWRAQLPAMPLERVWRTGWGFDRIYESVLVRPFIFIARAWQADPADVLSRGTIAIGRWSYGLLSRSQNGRLRRYAGAMAAGVLILITLGALL